MTNKRKSFAQAAAMTAAVAAPSPAAANNAEPDVEYRKFTVPLRSEQIREIDHALARLELEHEVKVTKALVIRLAIDEVLVELAAHPERVLQRLYRLEQQEVADHDARRVRVSRGLEAYLRETGAL
jgi:hypothetical protein